MVGTSRQRSYSTSAVPTLMSGAVTTVPHCLVHHALDILKLLNGCLIAVRIQIFRTKVAGLHCIRRPVLDTSMSPGYYSSTRSTSMPEVTMAGLHYT